MKSNAQPFHSPRRTSRSPSDSRRVIARISAHVKSATDSVSTSGVLVTTMPRDARVGDVDVVVADGDVRDDLQLRAGVDHRLVDLLGEHAHERVLAGHARAQLGRRHDALAGEDIDRANRFELRQHRRWERACDEN